MFWSCIRISGERTERKTRYRRKNVFFQQIFEARDECRWRQSKAVPGAPKKSRGWRTSESGEGARAMPMPAEHEQRGCFLHLSKVMLCYSTAVTLTNPCNPIHLVYSREPEAHSNFLKVCSVSQVGFITSSTPELLSLPSQTSFELDWLRFSHHVLDEPLAAPLCRACGIHHGSLSTRIALLSTSSFLGLSYVLEV